LLGWQNTATYGSVISYNVYWIFITFCILCMLYEEKTGHLPLKRPIVRCLSKIPGVGSYVRRKQGVSQEQADELVREGHDYLQTEQGGQRKHEQDDVLAT
jgi:high-affinity iron transporter